MPLVPEKKFAGLIAEWGNFFVCDNNVEIKAENAIDVMTARHAIVTISYMFVVFTRLLV